LEKEAEVGGLCRSKKTNGFTFDYDGHLLHFRHNYTLNLVKGILGGNLAEHKRNAWVYSHQRYIRYPFQANLHSLPSGVVKECLLGLISRDGQFKKKKEMNFSEWINHNFGRGIARHFMVPYNTKFWTLHPKELTCEWLYSFIPVPSLSQMVEGTIKDNKREFGYNARFWYPKKGGINQLSLSLASFIKNIHTSCKIVEIDLDNKKIKMDSGDREKFDYLISTIPLPELAHLLKKIPGDIKSLFKKLKWNSIYNLNLGIDKKDYTGRHWAYFPQRDIHFFRVGFPHNLSSNLTPPNKSSLYVEVSYSNSKPIDKNNIVMYIEKDLKRAGILTAQDKICAKDTNDIIYGYPIYNHDYKLARENIVGFLKQNNIMPCGRYGSWRYMSMEDTILDAKDTARQLK
jgi:UDP-galactopyranose mutase